MKTIAFYLPQYHSIPENDKWWGKGFTEWVNVKASKPLFKGHHQPEIPMDNNYYCLLDSETQEWQSALAQRYGVDGFCYYHYWFEGKLLLEKPMENMLKNPKVDIPFCVCWANETWARTWNGQESNILIKQNYDESKEAWEDHFNYLLPFFYDERYIKEDGKPLFVIYKPHLIKYCKEMIEFWNELAVKAGMKGIYFGYQHPSAFEHNLSQCHFDFNIEFEPTFTANELKRLHSNFRSKMLYGIMHPKWVERRIHHKLFHKPDIQDYDEIWERIIERPIRSQNTMPGAFPAWDNTPRRKNDAAIFYESTPEKFEKYLSLQVKKCKENNVKYFFINAWNEWAEGAHLEPDQRYGYGYLKALKNSLGLEEN